MATLVSFKPIGIRASATSDRWKSESDRGKNSRKNWWTPIFGWTAETDYFEGEDRTSKKEISRSDSGSDAVTLRGKYRFNPGCFTEEKAKHLRLKTMETATFHDIMYHSAIASRLASDHSDRSRRNKVAEFEESILCLSSFT